MNASKGASFEVFSSFRENRRNRSNPGWKWLFGSLTLDEIVGHILTHGPDEAVPNEPSALSDYKMGLMFFNPSVVDGGTHSEARATGHTGHFVFDIDENGVDFRQALKDGGPATCIPGVALACLSASAAAGSSKGFLLVRASGLPDDFWSGPADEIKRRNDHGVWPFLYEWLSAASPWFRKHAARVGQGHIGRVRYIPELRGLEEPVLHFDPEASVRIPEKGLKAILENSKERGVPRSERPRPPDRDWSGKVSGLLLGLIEHMDHGELHENRHQQVMYNVCSIAERSRNAQEFDACFEPYLESYGMVHGGHATDPGEDVPSTWERQRARYEKVGWGRDLTTARSDGTITIPGHYPRIARASDPFEPVRAMFKPIRKKMRKLHKGGVRELEDLIVAIHGFKPAPVSLLRELKLTAEALKLTAGTGANRFDAVVQRVSIRFPKDRNRTPIPLGSEFNPFSKFTSDELKAVLNTLPVSVRRSLRKADDVMWTASDGVERFAGPAFFRDLQGYAEKFFYSSKGHLILTDPTLRRVLESLGGENEGDAFLDYLLYLEEDDSVVPKDAGDVFHDLWDAQCVGEDGLDHPDLVRHASRLIPLTVAHRTLNPGHPADEWVVLMGDEGVGKSKWAAHLLPRPQTPDDTKDSWMNENMTLAGELYDQVAVSQRTVIAEVNEAIGLDRTGKGKAKAAITTSKDTTRLRFSPLADTYRRYWAAYITTNEDDPLPSDRQNRRFIPVRIRSRLPKSQRLRAIRSYFEENRDAIWKWAVRAAREGVEPVCPDELDDARQSVAMASRHRNRAAAYIDPMFLESELFTTDDVLRLSPMVTTGSSGGGVQRRKTLTPEDRNLVEAELRITHRLNNNPIPWENGVKMRTWSLLQNTAASREKSNEIRRKIRKNWKKHQRKPDWHMDNFIDDDGTLPEADV